MVYLVKEFKDKKFDSTQIDAEVSKLVHNEDLTNRKDIYEYVFKYKEKHLNIRAFRDNQKRESYEKQNGDCPVCKNHFKLEQMEADHITPWHEGGRTSTENCQMLCEEDNRRKSDKLKVRLSNHPALK